MDANEVSIASERLPQDLDPLNAKVPVSAQKLTEEDVAILAALRHAKMNNLPELAYGHLPDSIRNILVEWDPDQSGSVSLAELTAAAQSHKKTQQQGYRMKQTIAVLLVICALGSLAVFVLSYLAAFLAQTLRVSDTGLLTAADGLLTRVFSADLKVLPDGSLVMGDSVCPGPNVTETNGTKRVKVEVSEERQKLASTLADEAFEQLQSFVLTDGAGRSLKLQVTGFQRLRLRSSKCGSVIRLFHLHGMLTLDDFEVTVDDGMEQFIKNAGMGDLLDAGTLFGFGRRLSESFSLEGVFSIFRSANWTCTSMPLPSPQELPAFYRATVRRKERAEASQANSKMFVGANGTQLPLPGIQMEGGLPYKTWTEEVFKSRNVFATWSHFGMHPFQRQLRLETLGEEATLQVLGSKAFRCQVRNVSEELEMNLRSLESNDTNESAWADSEQSPRLEYLGISVEDSIVLRHWRIELPKGLSSNITKTEDLLLEAMSPDLIEYFDVDTDPSGTFQSGDPFRYRAYSSQPGSTIDMTLEYLAVSPLPEEFTTFDVFGALNVTSLHEACVKETDFKDDEAEETTEPVSGLWADLKSLPLEEEDEENVPPPLRPWVEVQGAVMFALDRLVELKLRKGSELELKMPYWMALMQNEENKQIIEAFRPEVISMDNETDVHNDQSDNFTDFIDQSDENRRLSTPISFSYDFGDWEFTLNAQLALPSRLESLPVRLRLSSLPFDQVDVESVDLFIRKVVWKKNVKTTYTLDFNVELDEGALKHFGMFGQGKAEVGKIPVLDGFAEASVTAMADFDVQWEPTDRSATLTGEIQAICVVKASVLELLRKVRSKKLKAEFSRGVLKKITAKQSVSGSIPLWYASIAATMEFRPISPKKNKYRKWEVTFYITPTVKSYRYEPRLRWKKVCVGPSWWRVCTWIIRSTWLEEVLNWRFSQDFTMFSVSLSI